MFGGRRTRSRAVPHAVGGAAAALRKLRDRVTAGNRSPDSEEVRYWRSWIATRGAEWPEAFERALDPLASLGEPLLEQRIAALPVETVEILDVGAGPMTVLGEVHPAKQIRITAVDPLAHEYDALLREAGLSPPVRTAACAGEELVAWCGERRFNVAYARNSVDHSADPTRVIEQMFAVLRTGGLLALRHYQREGEAEGYAGMHQWNLDIEDGDFVLWGEGQGVNLSERFSQRAGVECWLQETEYHAPFVLCVMTKTRD